MAHLYYGEHLTRDELRLGATVEITGDEARHAVRVSRLRVGETILVGNGAGILAHGEVTAAERDRFALRVTEIQTVEAPETKLVLAQALAKGDRDERAVEQATEFGVDGILPWEADRSVSRWGTEKAVRGTEKWQRISREAAKQSLRAWVPTVHAPHRTAELTALARTPESAVLVLHPRGSVRLSAWAGQVETVPQTIFLVVGPEGGISDAELEQFEAAGAHIVQLGDTVLRTSSAGPAALAILNVSLGRW